MQRITTATRVPDLFGPGKDGFTDTPPDATELDAAWFNNVQEEIANAIEDQGIVLDGTLSQLTTALNSWGWSGTPTVKAGAELVVETGAPGGRIRCESGAEIQLESGSDLTADPGSTCTFNGAVLVGGTGSLTVNPASTFNGTILCNGIVTLAAGAFLGAQEIEGGVGSVVDVETVEALGLVLDDAGVTLPPAAREVRYNDTTLTIQESDGQVRAIDVTDRGYQSTFSTVNAFDTTGATCGRRIQETEPVWIRVTYDFRHTTGGAGTLNTRIQVSGPGVVDISIRSYDLKAAGGFQWSPFTQIYPWVPTNDFVGPGTTNYTFTVRVGSSLGATLELRDIGIEVVSTLEV